MKKLLTLLLAFAMLLALASCKEEEKKAERIKRIKKIIEKQIAEIIKPHPHLNELPLPSKGIYRNNYLNGNQI